VTSSKVNICFVIWSNVCRLLPILHVFYFQQISRSLLVEPAYEETSKIIVFVALEMQAL
jgi:hypothetical protein